MAIPPPKAPNGSGALSARPSGEDALARSKREKEELSAEVQKIEEEIEELKVKYEMYFLGTERREPIRWREDLKKKVLRAKSAFTRNTGLRFKIQSLHARFISYERLWLRSAREKEEGTYRRDLFKARLRHRDAAEEKRTGAKPEAEDVDVSDLTPPPAAREPRAGTLGEPQMRALYDAYVSAKRRCNEDVSKLSYDAVARSVAKQIPELMDRYKASSVDFKVVIKDGRAVLKAIPRS